MTRPRGFALLVVLWTLAAVGGAVAVTMTAVRVGERASRNRVMLARARWAAEACLAVATARYLEGRATDTATIDLGRGTACSWRLEDPSARVNINLADRTVLQRLLESGGLAPDSAAAVVDAVVARRSIMGFRSVDELAELTTLPGTMMRALTVDGSARVNMRTASGVVLAALPGMSQEAVTAVLGHRAQGAPLANLDMVAALLSPVGRETLLGSFAQLARLVVFDPPQLLLTAVGWVSPDGAPRATIELLVVPLPERLAVVRRRMW